MATLSPESRRFPLPLLAACCMIAAGPWLAGCGPTEEAFEDEEWETTAAPAPSEAPAPSSEASLSAAVDSLTRGTLVLQGQVDALTAENMRMRDRIAELETKLRDAQTAAPAAAPLAPSVSPSSDLKAAYAEALDQFMNRKYQTAIQQFEAILQTYGQTDLEDNCTYWIGESYYALKNYSEAIRQFERVLEYTTSGKKPYAQLMIGNAHLALGERDAARDAFNAVVSSYPTSPLVGKAQEKLSRLY